MDQIGSLRIFVKTVEAANFSSAARAVSMTASAISKLVSRLEARHGVRLFQRTPRGILLTPEGELFYAHARKVVQAFEEAEAAMANVASSASGQLKLYVFPSFALHQIAPHLPKLLERHPDLRVEFQLGNAPLRMIDSGIDIAIQSGPMTDSSLVARRFTTSRWCVCASPDYVTTHGAPRRPEDLEDHECVLLALEDRWNVWSFRDRDGREIAFRPRGRVSANYSDMVLSLVKSGVGVARLPEFNIVDDVRAGNLVLLLEDYAVQARNPIYVVYHSRKHLSPRVSAFLDFLSENFGDQADWEISA
ncbi:MAG: transcriptional regulator, LysR family [Phenylobacterium sp.]|nr:transcriptional regulator, LysR family [Phenylobacterium sp.]